MGNRTNPELLVGPRADLMFFTYVMAGIAEDAESLLAHDAGSAAVAALSDRYSATRSRLAGLLSEAGQATFDLTSGSIDQPESIAAVFAQASATARAARLISERPLIEAAARKIQDEVDDMADRSNVVEFAAPATQGQYL